MPLNHIHLTGQDRISIPEIVQRSITLLGLIPSLNVHLQTGGDFVVDPMNSGLQPDEESGTTLLLRRHQKETRSHSKIHLLTHYKYTKISEKLGYILATFLKLVDSGKKSQNR
jgi:hypothetical protein